MKKIAFIVLSLTSCLIIANTAHGLIGYSQIDDDQWPPIITRKQKAHPCFVINRAGIKNPNGPVGGKDVWIPVGQENMDLERCRVLMDKINENYSSNGDLTPVYFQCEQQQTASWFELRNVLMALSSDDEERKSCSMGKHGGYDTALLFFQLNHVGSTGITVNPRTKKDLVDDNYEYIDNIVDETMRLSLELGRQVIFSDVRTFWEDNMAFVNYSNDFWASKAVEDQLAEAQDPEHPEYVPFSDPELIGTFRAIGDFVIMPPKDGKATVSIVIDDLGERNAFLFRENTNSSTADGRKPRVVIRGWKVTPREENNVVLGSAGTFLRTEGDINAVLTRVLIDGSIFTKTIFSLSGGTGLNLCEKNPCQGVTVDLHGNLNPVVFEFRGVPGYRSLRTMASGLHISYVKSANKNVHPIPLLVNKNGEEQKIPCTLTRDPACNGSQCATTCAPGENLDQVSPEKPERYLVFKPDCREPDNDNKQECEYVPFLSRKAVHLPESPEDPPYFVYVIYEKVHHTILLDWYESSGARIEYVFPDEDEDEDEDASSDSSEDNSSDSSNNFTGRPREIKINPQAPGILSQDLRTDNEDPEPPDEPIECKIHEHLDEDLNECVCDDGYFRNEGNTCTKDQPKNPILKTCAEGDTLVLAGCVPDLHNPDPNPADDFAFGAEGGCSLIASQKARSWAPLVLVIFALLGLVLCRRFRRCCCNCKSARPSTQNHPSHHICKCSTKCC